MASQLSVDEWIERGLDIGRKQWGHYPWPAKSTFYAWTALKGLREPNSAFSAEFEDYVTHDPNLACAEHYMFARWIVSVIPLAAPVVTFMSAGYQLNKLAGLISEKCMDIDLSIKFGHGPVSPPSVMQVQWEMMGIQRGLVDAPLIGPFPNPGFAFAVLQEMTALARDNGWIGSTK